MKCFKITLKVEMDNLEKIKCRFKELYLQNSNNPKECYVIDESFSYKKREIYWFLENINTCSCYIQNDSNEIEKRIDYLLDEEWEIKTLEFEIFDEMNNKLNYEIIEYNQVEITLDRKSSFNLEYQQKSVILSNFYYKYKDTFNTSMQLQLTLSSLHEKIDMFVILSFDKKIKNVEDYILYFNNEHIPYCRLFSGIKEDIAFLNLQSLKNNINRIDVFAYCDSYHIRGGLFKYNDKLKEIDSLENFYYIQTFKIYDDRYIECIEDNMNYNHIDKLVNDFYTP